jgi:rod shape-determining protein MreC
MALVDLRQRAGYLFLAVTLAEILLISAQVNARSGVPILEAVTFGIFAEAERVLTTATTGLGRVWSGYVALRAVKADNDRLRRDLASVQVELQQQRAQADRARGLEQMLGLRDHSGLQTVAAQIIGGSATPDFRTITIDKGSLDGLKADMAVIAPDGIVGRIVLPTPRSGKVQLMIDRNAAAGALIERSRAQGIVIGEGDDRMRMDYVAESADVVVGDAVVSSGIDGIYPKGYAIGRVEMVEKTGPAYKRIVVKPAVDFSRIEDVLVVLTPTPARDAGESSAE